MTDLHLPPLMTARYQGYKRAHGVPVRTTVGRPRFWNSPEPLEYVAELAPHGIFKNPALPTIEEREVAYMARLDDKQELMFSKLRDLGVRYPGRPLLLLCFDGPGVICHRHWAAHWFADRHGIVVPEWGTMESPCDVQIGFDF